MERDLAYTALFDVPQFMWIGNQSTGKQLWFGLAQLILAQAVVKMHKYEIRNAEEREEVLRDNIKMGVKEYTRAVDSMEFLQAFDTPGWKEAVELTVKARLERNESRALQQIFPTP